MNGDQYTIFPSTTLALLLIGLASAAMQGCEAPADDDLDAVSKLQAGDLGHEHTLTSGYDPMWFEHLDPDDFQEGVTTLFETESRVYGVFKQNNEALFFEVSRGPCKPIDGQRPTDCADDHPDEIPWEIDARFVNRDNVGFVGLVGGHDFQELRWNDAVRATTVNAEERTREFQLAQAAAQALSRGLQHEHAPEARALELLAQSIEYDVLSVDHAPRDVAPATEPTPHIASYYHKINVYRGAAFNLPIVDHSAVLVFTYNSSWTPLNYWMYGNHGRHHNESGMAYYCNYASGLRSNYTPAINAYADCGAGDSCGGGCGSPYGLTNGKHVCNDDSHAQVGNIKANLALSWLLCGDANLNGVVDSCASI